jgi:8-oxo-dGTP pyrophosphatase MutT (NUDIX family)
VGGEREDGEAPERAAAREALEEVGLVVRVGALMHESLSPDGAYRLRWFHARPEPAVQRLGLHVVEVEEARWLAPEEGLDLDPLLPGLKAWLEERVRTGRPRSP